MTIEAVDMTVLAAILVMALANYFVRTSGFWLMGHVTLTPRMHRMLAALPGSVVMATIVPLVAKGGFSGMVSVAIAAAAMIILRNEFLAVAACMATAFGLRAAGL